jgi:hypothetical protein
MGWEVDPMSYRAALHNLIPVLLLSTFLPGQNQTSTPANTNATDFPVLLQQVVVAGKTPAGTKIQARLTIATLFNGTVIPRNALLSGEVAESSVKTATEPSRLSILVDSAQWKNGSATLKLYFTGWYYPTTAAEGGQDLQYGPPEPANRTWNGQGQYPDPNSKVYRPFPGGDSDKGSAVPDTPASATSKNRVLMKDVEAQRNSDGGIALVSKRSNIKLEKYTTYVLSAAAASTVDSPPQK